MKTYVLSLVVATVAAAQSPAISGARIRADVKFLSSDLLEGRGVGARGGRIATEYLAAQFALLGAQPAGDSGTYFQKVPLVGIETQPDAQLSAVAGGRTVPLKWLDDFVGSNQKQRPSEQFDAEAVFVGHGIVAPEFQWDDYKGADVRGKVVVLFTNEPDSTDPKFFGGKALTYYGRWTYKYEEALRKGALACIIIHTTPTAGYGWEVVRNSWGREKSDVRRAPNAPGLALEGWVTGDAGGRILALSGHNVDELLKASNARDFRPIPLGLRIRARIDSKISEQDTRNVVAVIPGSDALLKSQAVVFSAHWDHLGIGTPVAGDAIYNGAVDNATGCGILLEMARAWAALDQKPRRSAVFVALTAEEAGLLGSEYYADHPYISAGRTAAALNFDGFYPTGRTRDVVVTGAERTTLWTLVEEATSRTNFQIASEAHPEQGSYYRSDHFSFARAGIPSFSINQGDQFLGKAAGYGEELFREFNSRHYHQPSDEYHEDWDFSGLEQAARLGMLIGINTANLDALPGWKAGDEFFRVRQQSLR
jgi:Zn-dependent M28 family amino/carboxypeptidase